MELPNSYDNDLGIAPLDPDEETEVRHERPDPYEVAVDRKAVERNLQSDLGKYLTDTLVTANRIYIAGMKAGQ